MIGLAALSLVALVAVPQDPGGLMQVERSGGSLRVAADRAGVPCDLALVELAEAMGWRLSFQPAGLEDQLSAQTVDLALRDESPRTLAKLLCLAGGADLVFHERPDESVDVTVVPSPNATTVTGRTRLRGQALDWYRDWLQDSLRRGLENEDESQAVRWRVAELLREQGSLEESARLYAVLCGRGDHEMLPAARLRLATVLYEIGPEHFVEAERAAREVCRLHAGSPEAAEGAILLGRLLAAAGRHRECVQHLEHSYVSLSGSPELIDAYLLMAEVQLELGHIEQALDALRQLEAHRPIRLLEREHRRQAWLLRGLAEIEAEAYDAATEALSELVAESDPATVDTDSAEHGRAMVALGEASLGAGRFLQAASVVAAIRAGFDSLEPDWRRRAMALEARLSIALGEVDQGIELLEAAVAAGEPDALDLMLARRLHAVGRLQRARELTERLIETDGPLADEARALLVSVALESSEGEDASGRALTTATRLATAIADQQIRAEAEAEVAVFAMQAGVVPPVDGGSLGPQALVESAVLARREGYRLERSGGGVAADAMHALARKRFGQALEYLAAAAESGTASLQQLFDLGRCEEGLGRPGEAVRIWTEVVRRDRDSSPGAGPVAGAWGRAAGTAMSVVRWAEETDGWQPPVDVDSIHWDSR